MPLSITKTTAALLLYVGFALAQPPTSTPSSASQQPNRVTLCQLAQDPAAYNHAFVRLSGTATQGFENFTFSDPSCEPPVSDQFSLWLTYGGTMQSDTTYCCPGEGGKQQRQKPIEVEGIHVALVNDAHLNRFVTLLKHEPHTVRATLIGVFFAGEQHAVNGHPTLPGYGHLGCCSLLVIQQVEAAER